MAQKTISFRFTKNGVLTNVTSVVLSDSGATYGVKRNDTDGVVVAAGTALTHDGTGLYSYTFSEPAAGLTYTAWIQWVYNGETRRVERQLTGSPASGYMTLTDARALVRQFGRNTGGDSSNYSDADVDRAIQFVGNHFCRETRALKQVDDVALTTDDAAADFSGLSGFRPERMIAAWLDNGPADYAPGLELVDWDTLWRLSSRGTTASGVPQQLAFSDWSTAKVYPTPGDDYTMKVRWTPPFTSWTAGTGSPGSVTLNVPTDWLLEILPYGPPAVLQHNEVEHRYASESWKKYLEIVERIRGEGGLGARQSSRAAVGGVGGYRYGGGMYAEGQREVP